MEGIFFNSVFFSVLSVATCVAAWLAAAVALLRLALGLVPGVSAGEIVVREVSEDDDSKGESLVTEVSEDDDSKGESLVTVRGGKVDGWLLVGMFMPVELSLPCSGGLFFVVACSTGGRNVVSVLVSSGVIKTCLATPSLSFATSLSSESVSLSPLLTGTRGLLSTVPSPLNGLLTNEMLLEGSASELNLCRPVKGPD